MEEVMSSSLHGFVMKRIWISEDHKSKKNESLGKSFYSLSFNFQKDSNSLTFSQSIKQSIKTIYLFITYPKESHNNFFSRFRGKSYYFWSRWRYPEQTPQSIIFHSNKWQWISAHNINVSLPNSTYQRCFNPWQRREKRVLMIHKYRGSM